MGPFVGFGRISGRPSATAVTAEFGPNQTLVRTILLVGDEPPGRHKQRSVRRKHRHPTRSRNERNECHGQCVHDPSGDEAAAKPLLLCPILWVMSAAPSIAQSRGLEGYWRGSGFIKVKDAPKERVRCRVTYSRRSSNTYSVDAKCASQGANITQSGQVANTGRNRYAGKFYNSDYNVRGRIRITIRGNRQYVTLRSEAGSGNLMLFRR